MIHEYDYTATIAGGIQLEVVVEYEKKNDELINDIIYQVLPDGTREQIEPDMPIRASIIGDVLMSNHFAEA